MRVGQQGSLILTTTALLFFGRNVTRKRRLLKSWPRVIPVRRVLMSVWRLELHHQSIMCLDSIPHLLV